MNDNSNHRGSNWGAGTPRSLQEAFGDGSSPLLEQVKRSKWPDVVAFLVSFAMGAGLIFFAVEVATRIG